MILELCIETLEGAHLGLKYGIDRVELCSALSVGGITPGIALRQKCVDIGLEVHAMLRPREGNFVYSSDEIELMLLDLHDLARAGVKGVVFGCLNADNSINLEANKKLAATAKDFGLKTTFHRAFDLVKDPKECLETLVDLGFDRLLTSGQKSTAMEGADCIAELTKVAGRRIEIMAGSGVNENNALKLAALRVDALHFTSHKSIDEGALGMGQTRIPDEVKIKSIIRLFR